VAYVRDRGVPITPAEDVQAVQGRGVTAKINGVPYWLGSHRYLEELGQETTAVHDRLESLSSAGRTVVVMGKQDHVCGLVTLADTLRPESADIIRALHQAGVEHVVMLTGDNKPTADRIVVDPVLPLKWTPESSLQIAGPYMPGIGGTSTARRPLAAAKLARSAVLKNQAPTGRAPPARHSRTA
jgi:hypothetical protein